MSLETFLNFQNQLNLGSLGSRLANAALLGVIEKY